MSKPETAEQRLGIAIQSLRSPDFEANLCGWLSTHINVDDTTVLVYSARRAPRVLFARAARPEVHAFLESDYVTGAYVLDPFYILFRQRIAEDLYRLRDISPDNFHRSEYFLKYYHRTTVIDEVSFVTWPTENICVQISLGRDAASDRAFSTADLRGMRQIVPIVTALACQAWGHLHNAAAPDARDLPSELKLRLREIRDISLSARQAEIALLILRGHSSVSIGLTLGISEQTVKVFRKQLYRKCGISSQVELFSLILPLLQQIGP